MQKRKRIRLPRGAMLVALPLVVSAVELSDQQLVDYDSFAPQERGANGYWDTRGYVEPSLSSSAGTLSGELKLACSMDWCEGEMDRCSRTADDSDIVKVRRHPQEGLQIIIR